MQLKKTSNWKPPGPDGLQGYWLKNFTAPERRLVQQLDECLQQEFVPEWMNEGKTVLIMKDKELGPLVSNFLLVTCLPLM